MSEIPSDKQDYVEPAIPAADVALAAKANDSEAAADAPLTPNETDTLAPSDDSAVQTAPAFELEGMELRPVLEAILFSSDAPLSAGKLAQTLGLDSSKPVKLAVQQLNESYGQRQAAYRIEERAGGYQLLTLPQYAQYIQRLTRARDEGRLTPAALETLAIIAYRQPILRVDVEAIRGVACGEVIRTLMEYNLVKIVGRAEEIGRPMLYGTTRHFLELFGLSSLKDLPQDQQLKEPKSADRNNGTDPEPQ